MYGSYDLNSSLNLFTTRCDELIASRYIVASAKISDLLKCIVTNQDLEKLARKCMQNYNFEVDFLKAKTLSRNGNINKYNLELPKEKNKMFAFVFCLLCEFDLGHIDMHRFLSDFFYIDGSTYESYNEFCRQVIKPFKRNVEILIQDMNSEQDDSEASARAEKYFSEAPTNINNNMVEELLILLQELSQKVANDSSLNLSKKQELLDITDGLNNAIITRDAKFIKLLWIGFKNTFKGIKIASKITAQLEEKLASFWII